MIAMRALIVPEETVGLKAKDLMACLVKNTVATCIYGDEEVEEEIVEGSGN